MKISSLWLLFCILFLSCKEENKIIHYTINALSSPKEEINVNFNYKSNDEGKLVLKYENDSWGDYNIYDCITNFNVSPETDSIIFDRDSSYITIYAAPNNTYSISYGLKRDFDSPLLNKHRNRPIVYPEYFHLLGMRLFILPDALFPTETSKIELSYTVNLPDNAVFHSSFGKSRSKVIHTSREELYASIFLGGDFRIYEGSYKNKPVIFLTRGSWKNLDEEVVYEMLMETISFQHEFWNDSIEDLFTVSLLPTYEEWTEYSKSSSLGGSGLTQSFISFASDNPATTLDRLRWLYNHELMHKWIGGVIQNKDEEKQYWFSEGFTDYYAYKMVLNKGNISLSDYINKINTEVLQPHYTSPINSIPNREITWEKFWSDYNYQKLPYRRGFIYAFYLDHQIRIKSNGKSSLDDLMKDILETTLKTDKPFDHSIFQSILVRYMGENSMVEFVAYIENGDSINLSGKLLPGLGVRSIDKIPQLEITGDTTSILQHLK